MSIEIVIPPFLQRFTADSKSVAVTGSTVGACLDKLVGQYPELKERLFTARGKLRHCINIFVNREAVPLAALGSTLKDTDKIYITSIIMGG
jgi:molybdopterin converting factor small subunit